MTVTPLPAQWPPYAGDFVLPKFCEDGLACVVTHYADIGVPLPDRQYWTIGTTAHDCEQVVLAVQQMFLGTAAQPLETSQCSGPRSLTFTIEVIRCVPALDNHGRAPAADSIETASVNPVVDMEALMDCSHCFDPFSAGIVVTIDAIPASGGMHGMIATYTANL